MRRALLRAFTGLLVLTLVPLAGCGDESTTVEQSPEAKKADNSGQDAMREYMQSKSKSKSKAKAEEKPADKAAEKSAEK